MGEKVLNRNNSTEQLLLNLIDRFDQLAFEIRGKSKIGVLLATKEASERLRLKEQT